MAVEIPLLERDEATPVQMSINPDDFTPFAALPFVSIKI